MFYLPLDICTIFYLWLDSWHNVLFTFGLLHHTLFIDRLRIIRPIRTKLTNVFMSSWQFVVLLLVIKNNLIPMISSKLNFLRARICFVCSLLTIVHGP